MLICIIAFFFHMSWGCQAYVNILCASVISNFYYEGAAKEDGKGPSIWDTYTHEHPGHFFSLSLSNNMKPESMIFQ